MDRRTDLPPRGVRPKTERQRGDRRQTAKRKRERSRGDRPWQRALTSGRAPFPRRRG